MPLQQLKALAHDAKQLVCITKVATLPLQLFDDAFLPLKSSLRAEDDEIDVVFVVEIKCAAASDKQPHQIINEDAAIERPRTDRSCGQLSNVLAAVSGQEEEGDRAVSEAVADGINRVVAQLGTKHGCGEAVADGGQ